MLIAFALILTTSCAMSVAVISWQSLNASTIEKEREPYSLVSNSTKLRCCCKATMGNMDKYHAGLLNDYMRESIERHIADCPHCYRVYHSDGQ